MGDLKEKALEAGRIYNSPVFRELWDDLDEKAVSEWRNAPTAEQREACWARVQALDQVKKSLFKQLENAAVGSCVRDESVQAAYKVAKTNRSKKKGDKA